MNKINHSLKTKPIDKDFGLRRRYKKTGKKEEKTSSKKINKLENEIKKLE